MKESLIEVIKNALREIGINEDVSIELNVPKQKENGDYSTNVAMKLASFAHDNPINLAQKIVKNINCPSIRNIEIKQPGFINFFVTKDYIIANIKEVLIKKVEYGRSSIGNGKRINIEFVSANPTGILHLGNARGGAYGDSLARIMRFCGYDVTEEYYINDAGNQINNLGESIKARYYEICGKDYGFPENGYHGKEIIDIAKEIYEEHKDTYLDQGIEYYKELGTKKLLNRIIEDLKRYRINYDVFTSEKDIAKRYDLNNLIQELTDNGYTYKQDGATWFKCSSIFDDKDHVLVKDDNSFTYLVPDIAYHKDKFDRGYSKLINLFGADHHGYIIRLKSAIDILGYDSKNLDVLIIQMVRLMANGEELKMSKRTGNAITIRELCEDVGVDAARYFFLAKTLDSQFDFDLDVARKNNSENPVYYIQYAYARMSSVLRKNNNYAIKDTYQLLNTEKELELIKVLAEFEKLVVDVAKSKEVHRITSYAYKLANAFHSLYNESKFIDENNLELTGERLALVKASSIVLKNALNLLGIEAKEVM